MRPMKTERVRGSGPSDDVQAVSAQIAELDAQVEAALADPAADPDRLRRLLADLRAAEAARDRLRSAALAALRQPRAVPTDPAVVEVLGSTAPSPPRPRRSTMSV